ncbi:hypothetical protein BJ322DRAFT_1029441 [Thelephora terrestris]|uniref:Uncharacterized protein n=1 Tax=Thelephora terrestris TaxID=56493 RepID=A0A9P6HPM9_9AGAM|nr:hypothetical protein BJ322DRAFT_1029441 [Thelephora terrestris]
MQEELPPYDSSSPLPGYITSRGLASLRHTISPLRGNPSVDEYSYKSDHLDINLGPRQWGTRFPVYGLQSAVEGRVWFAKKCSHVVSVTATLEGKLTTSVSRGGSLAAASDQVILSQSAKLFEVINTNCYNSKPSTTLFGECFDFSLSFLTYIANGRDPLPPSQSLSQQGTYCTINYTVRVDVIRKGLRRHERITIPIMYLPRSTPPSQVQLGLIHHPLLGYEQDQSTTIDLHNSNSARAALEKLQMSAQLTLPSPKIYTSGDSVPLILTLSCSKLPSLPQLLAKTDSLHIHLIRRAKIAASPGDILQETIVSKAELERTDNSSEGVSSSYWVLQLGKNQRHISWRVAGSAEVKYIVRVVFKPLPCSIIKQLPAFQYDEVIKLTSDPWLDPVIAEEFRQLPSLGLAPVGLTAHQLTQSTPRSSLSSPSTRL